LFIQNGLFAPPYQAEYTISTTVGSTFAFGFACDAASSGTVYRTGPPNNPVDNSASGWMAIGIVVGGEVVGADAQITSDLIGGPFPMVSPAAPANAQAALPGNPYVVPEPGFGASVAAGAFLAAVLRRRSERVQGR
ncbi:MAG: hypothetical protein AAGC67_22580, partial [Myxococcota bacterium]